MKNFIFAIALCLAVFGQGKVLAHPQKAAIATIELNERTGMVEIVHRFSQHDAEHVAHELMPGNDSIIFTDEVRRQFADYVVSSFALETPEAEAIKLTMIGHEFDHGYIYVYQEFEPSDELEGMYVTYAALQEIWPQQINTVNIKIGGPIKTLTFRGHTTRKFVALGS